jgi:hypothetical protein
MPQFPKKIGDPRFLTDINAFYISYPKLKEKSFLDLEKNALSMHVSKKDM